MGKTTCKWTATKVLGSVKVYVCSSTGEWDLKSSSHSSVGREPELLAGGCGSDPYSR